MLKPESISRHLSLWLDYIEVIQLHLLWVTVILFSFIHSIRNAFIKYSKVKYVAYLIHFYGVNRDGWRTLSPKTNPDANPNWNRR